MTNTQRMSDERLAHLIEVHQRGCAMKVFTDWDELLQALKAERAVVGELERGLRSCDCPKPCLLDRTIGVCVDAGICGCIHSEQLKSAIPPAPEQA